MTVETKDLTKAEIEFLSDKCEKLEKENTQLHKFLDEFNALEVAKENQQLKELLLDCRQTFLKAERNYGFDDSIIDICSPMIEKIDNAIGEK